MLLPVTQPCMYTTQCGHTKQRPNHLVAQVERANLAGICIRLHCDGAAARLPGASEHEQQRLVERKL